MFARKGKNIFFVLLKSLFWVCFSAILTVSAVLICAVNILKPEHLTPLVEKVANNYINGQVKLGNLQLGFRPAFPILGVEVENLTVISGAFESLSSEERGTLPAYADTLVTLDYMTGSLDLKRLLVDNEISLHRVILRRPGVNLVIAHNGEANYSIVKAQADTTETTGKMPGFRIDRFSLESPKEIRFFNAADSTAASILLLTDAAIDGGNQPAYRLKIDGNVTSPQATLITNLDQISFGVNGKVFWDPSEPGLVAVDEMELQGAFLKAVVAGEIDLESDPIARKATVDIAPVAISDLLTLLPDSIRKEHRLYAPYFQTDATISAKFELTAPMNLATDTIPSAAISIALPSSKMTYGKARFEELMLGLNIVTKTNEPDSTVLNINRCVVAGPATRLELSGTVATPLSDPTFDANVAGNMNLANLPPVLREKIPGYLAGVVKANLKAKGKASMFETSRFHRLNADGKVSLSNIYFLSADTNKMVELGKADIVFNTQAMVSGSNSPTPVLGMKLTLDTATVLVDGVDISLSNLSLGAGVENKGKSSDTTLIVPVGGGLKLARLNIISITDSAGARIRNLEGHLLLHRFKGLKKVPEIVADLTTGRVSAGSRSSRILINDAKIKASMFKLPEDPQQKALFRQAQRIRKEYPDISPDSVFRLAYEKRRHKPGEPRTKRVRGVQSDDDTEMLEWDLAHGFSRFLNQWQLNGSLTTRRARMLTPLFPLRNNFSRLDVKFSNDTIAVNNISIRAGHSDLTMSGQITNVRRALTSKRNNTLKINLSFLSDSIDINELSAGVFAGAAYAERVRRGISEAVNTENDSDLESQLDALAKQAPDTAGPLLIPVNVDAKLEVAANKVLYSDLTMQNMGGELLVFGGGVNLHNIKGQSDAGNISLSALYSAPRPEDMHFGFGLELEDFNIARFVKLVPAVDSIIPMIHDFAGTIDAELAATCRIDSGMNLVLPSLDAAIRISGDNLAFINPDTYRTLGKWLRFKDKTDNTIKHMNVEMTVKDGNMRVYPFAFNIDRYRLGVAGSNDLAMNFDYHIAVLKSPLPFKFGITISGNPDKYKVRFGGAKFKENTAIESVSVVKDARVNLVEQIENVFKRGVRNSRFAHLNVATPKGFETEADKGLSAADSLQLIQEGLIEAPVPVDETQPLDEPKKKRKKFWFF